MYRSTFNAFAAKATVLAALLAPACCQPDAAHATDVWPQFRGPGGQGNADQAALPFEWSETKNIAWKTPLPGRGWSSPVIGGGRIWLSTAEDVQATDQEREDIIKASSGLGPVAQMAAAKRVTLSALEIDLATGELLRTIVLFDVEKPPLIHGLNSFASPTCVLAEGRLVCHFGTMGTACVDAKSGEKLWERKLEIDHIVGPGSSPVVYKNLVVITCDGGDKQFIEALDLATGDTVWRKDRPPIRSDNPDLRKAYSTPLVFTANGRDQMIVPGSQWFVCYDPATGDELWRIDHGAGFSNVPRPIFDGERLYLNTGFTKPQLWAVRVDGTGDVSKSHVDWRFRQQMPTMPSPVMADGLIFSISDGGVATCLEAKTGKELWRERVPGKYSASPLLGAGRVYFSSHEGHTTVVAASDEFKVLATNKLDGMLMASPAAVDGDLILRTNSHLYRIAD